MCLLVVGMMFLADGLGIPMIRGNPLPEPICEWLEKYPQATICGKVQSREDTKYSKSIILKNSYLIYRSNKISIEHVKVYLKENTEVPIGAYVVLSGKMQETEKAQNPGGFNSASYYACQHIYYLMKAAEVIQMSESYSVHGEILMSIRESLSDILENIASKDAGIFQAMILGDKTELEKETKTLYQMSGIIHILAISGLHISMLGLGFYKILKKIGLGIWGAGFLSLLVMMEYGMLTGSGVSTIRAVCMFVLSVGAQMLGRIYDMPTALALAAVLILMESPAYLYNSSFQLSFGAVIAIGVVTPIVLELLRIKRKWGQSLVSSLIVQMVTLPIVLCAYGEVSLIGVFLNLLVLPTVGIVLGSGVAGIIVGCGSLKIAKWLIFPGRIFLWIYEKMCMFSTGCSLFGGKNVTVWIAGAPEIWQIVVYYLLLVLGILVVMILEKEGCTGNSSSKVRVQRCKKNTEGRCLLAMRMFLSAMSVAAVCVLTIRVRSAFVITCLNVGQGDCAVISTEKQNFLVDCGSTDQSNVGEYCLIPFLKNQGIAYLDGIFVSHTDQDHISGIVELLTLIEENLTAIRVGSLILPEWEEKGEAYQELEELAKLIDVNVIYVSEGDILQAGELNIKILHPETGSKGMDTNEEGEVLEVYFREFCGLFMGDVSSTVEKELLPMLTDVDFLKVGHHGSKYSSCSEFLEKINAEIAVISCGEDNSYGHPHEETLKRLEEAGSAIWNIAEKGYAVVEVE